MNKKIKWGIIGLGNSAKKFTQDLARAQNSALHSVASRDREKAKQFSADLNGAVMASDAFFPFNDCVRMGHEAGITAFIQPGGSIRDQDSIDYCKQNGLAMVITGLRHFKH